MKDNLNFHVVHDFSTEFPSAYKEAFNDSLYYFAAGNRPLPYAFLDLGIHKIDPGMNFDKVLKQKHAMRMSRIKETSRYVICEYSCFCTGESSHWGGLGQK